MTHQAPPAAAPAGADPGRQLAQLREVLALVRRIAGQPQGHDQCEAQLDQAARVSEAYDRALPVVQRRFEALAGEAGAWAAAGVEALLAGGDGSAPRSAAARLADQLDRALSEMTTLLDRNPAHRARTSP